MKSIKLTPRLNYDFSFSDFVTSLKGIIGRTNCNGLEKYFPNSNIYYTNHARTGLRLLLICLDLPKGSKIGVTVYNCLTVFKCIELAGYEPVFIDSTLDYRMDLADLEKKNDLIDGLIVTHLFGITANIKGIKEIINGKPMIEDCAHSFLNKIENKYLGSFGIGSVFSFGHGKFPAAGEGGIVIVNDKDINGRFKEEFAKLRTKSFYSELVDVIKAFLSAILMNKYVYGFFTYKFKTSLSSDIDINNKYVFSEEHCNSGFYHLFQKRLNNIIDLKNRQDTNSKDILKEFYGLDLFSRMTDTPNFMIPVRSNNSKKLIESSINQGIEFGCHFSNSINWSKNFGYKNGDCKIAEKLIKETVTIPCYYALSESEVKHVIKILKLKQNKNYFIK